MSLAERLKVETRPLHVDVERSALIAALLRGRLDRHAYLSLLRNLQAIYAVLEPALQRHATHPAVAPFDLDALARVPALAADIATLDPGVAEDADRPLEPATIAYADHLADLDRHAPELLVAHAYVRYLGDLNGGQLLRRIVRDALQLPPGPGTAFYDFDAAPGVAVLAARFRDALDRSALSDADAVVAEAQAAFQRHRQLFDELARRLGVVSESGAARTAEPPMRRTADS